MFIFLHWVPPKQYNLFSVYWCKDIIGDNGKHMELIEQLKVEKQQRGKKLIINAWHFSKLMNAMSQASKAALVVNGISRL